MAPSPRAMRSVLCLLLLVVAANAGQRFIDCPSNTNYTRGGIFHANLDALLSSLPAAAAASSGLAKNTTGATPDEAYGLAQCRADINASDCRVCLDGLVRDMASTCPGQKNAMLFYETCLLRHANVSFFGAEDTSWSFSQSNWKDAAQPERFTLLLAKLMEKLTKRAAYASPRMFAVGTTSIRPFQSIYGMAECTRDLRDDGCDTCLVSAVSQIPNCCDGKEGGRVILRTCSIRFELYNFYNVQAAEAATGGVGVNDSDNSGAPPASTGSSSMVKKALAVLILVAVVLLVLLSFTLYLLSKSNRKLHMHLPISSADNGNGDEMMSSEFLLYDLSTLRAATGNFSEANKLGEGGFGPVYKGILQDGQKIAVKRLSTTSQQGRLEMKNEVVFLAKLQHKNLVRLLGRCIEEDEKLLVYEFLSNKSLDKILFHPGRQQELSWDNRHKIIQGIGRGLLYLHEDSRLTIIHRDLKASNILLDPDMNPKISDFGLAKLFTVDASVGNTSRIAGTYGYMAPEYAFHGTFSAKSDVFSYGVLVLEVVMGCRNAYGQDTEDLVSFVWRQWSHGNMSGLLESCSADGLRPQEMLRCIHVGLLCVQEDAHLRPAMVAVIVMLNSQSITLPAPTAPAYIVPSRDNLEGTAAMGRRTRDEAPTGVVRVPSINDGSISDLEPR